MSRAFYHGRFVARTGLAALVACGGAKTQPTTEPASSASSTPPAPPPRDTHTAYDLVISAASCWLGGLWGDAEGEAGAAERRAGTAKRCGEAARALTNQDDPMKVEALRVLDRDTTDDLVKKVSELAHADGLDDTKASDLQGLAAAIVAAARETSDARRAASRVRADVEKLRTDKQKSAARDRDADRLSAAEASVATALHSGTALEGLVKLSSGELTGDAHAIGLMFALVRVRAAEDLPKHMKLYTVAPAYAAVFGVPPPPLPERAQSRLKPGTWLAYVTQVAKACGHPVPDTAKTKHDKEQAAWRGVLDGFAEHLEADEPQIKSPVLLDAVKGVVSRLK